MSDARDAVSEALALNQRLAATLLVQKQELEAELATAPGEERAAALTGELERVDASYRAALAEIAELRRLGAGAGADEARAVVAAALNRDPVLQTDEERALAGAREHLSELEAQLRLGDESAGAADESEAPASPPSKKTREQADAEARAEFEALRARRAAPPPAPATDAPPSPPRLPKKTM